MTRGGGGQNLIGVEQAELLDVIRTEELLAARRLDGATQRFTRMRDFGYSKSAAETLAIWGHDEALADVVWVIRTLPARRDHHAASTSSRRTTGTTRRRRSSRARRSRRRPTRRASPSSSRAASSRGRRSACSGTSRPGATSRRRRTRWRSTSAATTPRLGLGYGELAARSRSQHKSQGFGVAGERGPLIERFVTVAGSRPAQDILDGVDARLEALRHAAAPRSMRPSDDARGALERDRPERALPALLERATRPRRAARRAARARCARWRSSDVIAARRRALRARDGGATDASCRADGADVAVEIVQRRPAALTLARRRASRAAGAGRGRRGAGARTRRRRSRATCRSPADAPPSAPYWLAEPSLAGRQVVRDPRLVGEPERSARARGRRRARASSGRPLRLATPVRLRLDRSRARRAHPPLPDRAARDGHAARARRCCSRTAPRRRSALRVRAEPRRARGRRDARPSRRVAGRARARSGHAGARRRRDHRALRRDAARQGGRRRDPPGDRRSTGKRWALREDVIDYPHIPMQVVLQPADAAARAARARSFRRAGSATSRARATPSADDLAHVGLTVETLDDETLRERRPRALRGDRRRRPRLQHARRRSGARTRGSCATSSRAARSSCSTTPTTAWRRSTTPIGPFPLDDRPRPRDRRDARR